MDRMQDSIKKVADRARRSAIASDLARQLEELKQAAEAPPLPDDLARLIGPD